MTTSALRRLFGSFLAILLIAGCALNKRAEGQNSLEFWHGRLALRAEPDLAQGQTQTQSFSAAFELQGDADAGELLLLTPLGSTAAAIRWTPAGAELQMHNASRQFGNLQDLVTQTLGSNLPVAALFQWLHGKAVDVDGWQADFSQFDQGKIAAHRDHPEPRAQLRLVLQR